MSPYSIDIPSLVPPANPNAATFIGPPDPPIVVGAPLNSALLVQAYEEEERWIKAFNKYLQCIKTVQ